MIENLSKTCSICGRDRKKKDAILYEPVSLTPYCANPYICGEKEQHPNFPTQLVKRGHELGLITAEEAKRRFNEVLQEKYPNPELMDRVSKLLTQPSTIRISEVEHAEFIIKLMDEYHFRTKTEVFRFCIMEAMKNHQELMYHAAKMAEQHHEPEEEELEEEEVVEEIPIPIHIEEPTPEPEPAKEESKEEEWTF